MYLPTHFTEPRVEELHRIARDNAFGMLVTHTAAGLEANHLPMLLDATQGAHGTLLAHVARANPLWQEVRDGDQVLAVFRGAQGYISPNWYPGKHETHRRVPTWNYEVVHAHGTIHVHDDERFLRGLLARLNRRHEADQPKPWKMGDSAPEYIDGMLRAIVGIEITLDRLEGKSKLSQNREPRDRLGAAETLLTRGADELGQQMRDAG